MDCILEAQYLSSRLDRREISREGFADAFTRLMVLAVGCRQTAVWVIGTTDDDPTLLCLGNHDTLARGPIDLGHSKGSRADFLRALDRDGAICAQDACTHPATSQLHRSCLAQGDIQSLMAVAFSINGELHGAFTCASVGVKMHWTAHQLATLKRLVARISPALARAELRSSEQGRFDVLPYGAGTALWIDPTLLSRRHALIR